MFHWVLLVFFLLKQAFCNNKATHVLDQCVVSFKKMCLVHGGHTPLLWDFTAILVFFGRRCAVAGKDGFHWVVLGIFQQNQFSAMMEDEYHWAKVLSISKIIMGAMVVVPTFLRVSQGF